MEKIRVHRVLIATLLFAAVLAYSVWKSAIPMPTDALPDSGLELNQLAAYRYEHLRGMTPCQFDEREITSRAREALRSAGVAESALIAVVAPTFEGTKVIAFGDHQISVLRFADKAGYTSPDSWFLNRAPENFNFAVSPSDLHIIVTPVIRQARYASTTSRGGHDGTVYYLDWGGECARTWSPDAEDGPSALVAQMLEEILSPRPSTLRLVSIAKDMEALDLGRGR